MASGYDFSIYNLNDELVARGKLDDEGNLWPTMEQRWSIPTTGIVATPGAALYWAHRHAYLPLDYLRFAWADSLTEDVAIALV